MTEAAAAVKAGALLVPVMVVGHGYTYSMPGLVIPALELDSYSPEEMTEVRKLLLDTITNTIAVDWNPALGPTAASKEILKRSKSFTPRRDGRLFRLAGCEMARSSMAEKSLKTLQSIKNTISIVLQVTMNSTKKVAAEVKQKTRRI
mmetsp:Transcript_72082/g.120041  ORF Transcript_72082/g.120041 Transcript_72082/m.120041 type:complete len:147 (+) Transcript_72082:2-442(+)